MLFFVIFAAALVAMCKGEGVDSTPVCPRRNAYLAIDGNCDSYIQCRENEPSNMICPDGLNFNPAAVFPEYPCSYPMDVPCNGRTRAQPPQPTANCPHQYGYFPSPVKSEDCSQYIMCIDGIAVNMNCPTGLAFNPDVAQCDWPEHIPGCNANAYLGFTCPPPSKDESGNSIVTNHRYEGDCYAFFSCTDGKAHLLSCDMGLAFDAVSGHCVDADLVACPVNDVPVEI
ncbi:unnamed protein product, partial [Brenthis ino]